MHPDIKRQSWPVGVPRDVIQVRFDWPKAGVNTRKGWHALLSLGHGGARLHDENDGSWGAKCARGQVVLKSMAMRNWHFCYQHAVDDHNNLRLALPSVKETWTQHSSGSVGSSVSSW